MSAPSNVVQLRAQHAQNAAALESMAEKLLADGPPTGGQPPYDGGMEARVTKLEETMTEVRERLVRIETRLEGVDSRFDSLESRLSSLPTHKDLHDLTWRIIGACALLVGATFAIARYIH